MIRSSHKNQPVDETPLDPKVEAELVALDAALRGEPIDDDHLATLVRDVQAQAPVLPTELRERLRDDVAAGFGRRGRFGLARRGRSGRSGAAANPRRRLALAGSGGGVLVAGLLVAFVMSSGSTEKSLHLDNDMASAPAAASADSATSSGTVSQDQLKNGFSTEKSGAADPRYLSKSINPQSTTSSAAGSASDLSGVINSSPQALQRTSKQLKPFAGSASGGRVLKARKVERAVDMEVRVKSGKLDEAVSKVGQIARQAGGFVATSSTSIGTRGAGNGSFTLRVASVNLDATVAKLSALGTVTHQDQQSTDITSSFDSAQQRLADATAVRRALLKALGKAKTAGEIASLRSRIADNRATRAALSTQLAQVARRADLSTITLSLTAPSSGAAAAADDNGTWSLGDAAHDTVRILGTVTGVLLVAAGAALPFAILALIGWSAYRVRRRASREAALNG